MSVGPIVEQNGQVANSFLLLHFYLNIDPMELFTDAYFMKRALQEAELARRKNEIPVGAVIVSQNRIIARAHNLTETLTDVTAHAEMQAITAAANLLGGKYLSECTLYVTVEPCVMCAGALGWSQVAKVVYGASDEKHGFRKYAPRALHPKTQVVGGILENECAQLMTEFFQKKR
jgi:tRNA(adenine34) deaminase